MDIVGVQQSRQDLVGTLQNERTLCPIRREQTVTMEWVDSAADQFKKDSIDIETGGCREEALYDT